MGERGAVHTFRARWTRVNKVTGHRVSKLTSGWAWRFAYHGKRYSGGGAYKSRELAREAGEARRREVVAGQIQDPRRTTYETLETIIRAEYGLRGERCARHVESYLKWLRTAFGGRLAADITRAELIAYIQARRATPTRGNPGASDGMIKMELNVLRRGMRLAIEAGRLLTMPRFPTIPTYPRKVFITEDEWNAIHKHLPPWWEAAFETAWICGWRFRSEVLSRTWRDIDWTAGVMRLHTGEGKKRRARVFPLTPRLQEILMAQLQRVEAQEREQGRVIPWVFPGPTGVRQTSPYGVWRTACKRAGVVGKIPHDLRRTFVRDLQLAGVPTAAGMAASGHTDVRTYRGYAGDDDGLVRYAVEKLGEQRAKPTNVVSIRRREGQTA